MKLPRKIYSHKMIVALMFFIALSHLGICQSPKWFYDIETALQNPEKVQYLCLREKGYKTFPEEVFLFKNLLELDLSMNPITEIPDEIVELTKLKELTCAYCSINYMSPSITKLLSLQKINLLDNNISSLPSNIGDLQNLEYLNLTINEVRNLPESIYKLKLKGLYLGQIKESYFTISEQKRIRQRFGSACSIKF